VFNCDDLQRIGGYVAGGRAGASEGLNRAMTAVLVLNPLIGKTRGLKDALFLGRFGPIGVAALYYTSLAPREAGVEEVWVVGSLIITASVIVHGMSAVSLTRLYGKRTQNDASGE
jgi:sodium/hydrogen antiporter